MEGANIDDSTTRGIIPRMVDTLFSKIQSAPGTIDFTIRVSMVEIYMEKIRDLLDEAGEKYLEVQWLIRRCRVVTGGWCERRVSAQIREHREQGIYLEGVRELNMTSPDMIYDVLRVGCAARSTASTRMNQVRDSPRHVA
jgi:kinesin family member 5